MKRFGWVAAAAAVSLFVAPLTAVPASGAAAAGVIDVKFGEVIDVPQTEDRLARIAVRFRGRAGQGLLISGNDGQLHTASCEQSTLTTGGRTVARGKAGAWLLPRTGTYRLDYQSSCRGSSSGGADYLIDQTLTLRRIVMHPGAVGERLNTRMTDSTWHAYRVPVPKGPGVRVSRFAMVETARTLFRPSAEPRVNSSLCRPTSLFTRDQRLGSDCDFPFSVRRSDDYVVLADSPVKLVPYTAVSTAIDSAASQWRGAGPRLLRFSGSAGDFVRLDTTNLDLLSREYVDVAIRLRGPAGEIYRAATSYEAYGDEPGADYQELMWQLPTDGKYAFEVAGELLRPRSKVTASVRSVKAVPLQLGVPVELAVGPDAWQFAVLPDTDTTFMGRITVVATSPGLAAGWRVFAPVRSQHYAPMTTVGAGVPLDTPKGIVVIPGPGSGSGTITVRLDEVPQ